MSCFCRPAFERALQDPALQQGRGRTPIALAPAAQAAHALRRALLQGIPDLGPPEQPLDLPDLDARRASAASAWSQVDQLARQQLGGDPASPFAATQLRRLSATLSRRLLVMGESIRGIDLSRWTQLAALDQATQDLQGMLDALDDDDDQGGADDDADDDPLANVAAPASWGGERLRALSGLADRAADPGDPLTPERLAQQAQLMRRVAAALAPVRIDLALLSQLTVGLCSMTSIRTGEDVRYADAYQAAREQVTQRFQAMSQLAERRGIDLSKGPEALPPPSAIPRFRERLLDSLNDRLRRARELPPEMAEAVAQAPDPLQSMPLAAQLFLTLSLSASLTQIAGVTVTHASPCSLCDLRPVMAELDVAAVAAAAPAAADAEDDEAAEPDAAGQPDGAPATASAPAAPGQAPAAAPPGPASPAAPGQPGAAPAADTPAAASASAGGGGGDGGGGGGGPGGGGGVPAVVMTAQLTCIFGAAPSVLTVLPINRTTCGKQVAANIMDHVPMVNILPFGMCITISNPMVAAATTAAFGVLTPQPCIPATATPWTPGVPTVLLGKMPMLHQTSICNCMWGGIVQVAMPGQMQTTLAPGAGGGAGAAVAAAKQAAAAKAAQAAESGKAAKEKAEKEKAEKDAAEKKRQAAQTS